MAQENKEINIHAWLVRVFNNWYWFLLSGIVFGLFGVFHYISSTNKYTVESEILLRDASGGSAFIQSDLLDVLGMNGEKSVDDEIAALTSRDVIQRVIKDLDLQVEYRKKNRFRWVGQYPKGDLELVCPPTFLDTMLYSTKIKVRVRKNDYVVKVEYGRFQHSKHIVTDLTRPISTCAGVMRFKVRNQEELVTGAQYKVSVYPCSSAINIYQKRISVAAVKKDSKVIEMSSVTDMPARSKDFMRKLIDLYNLDAMADKNLIAQNTATFINERVEALEEELIEAENNTVRYLEQYGLVNPWIESELFLNEDVEYRKQMTEVETQINMLTYLCEFMEDKSKENDLLPAMFMIPTYQSQNQDQPTTSNVGVSGLSLITAVDDYNSLIISKMRLDLSLEEDKQKLAQIDAELAALRSNIVTTVKNVRNTMMIAQHDLENHFVSANQQRNNMPDYVRKYERMIRQQRLKEKLYLLVCEQREENAMLLSSTIMPIKVITAPQTNPLRVSPHYVTILLFLVIGLFLPLGVMIVYDMLNNRVSDDPKDLAKRLNVSLAGLLVKNATGEFVAVGDGENSAAAESFRSLRTNICFMQPVGVKCPILLVTSGVDGEGKSYVATNLAISMALLGKKVALVELDVRKPMLATSMNLPTQGCLTTYLSGSIYTWQDTVVPSAMSNLDVLPAGMVPQNPNELLQGERLDELFAELRKVYDYVIVDSASLALVSDAYMLGRVADMTVGVLRANRTTFDLVDFLNQANEQQRLPKMVAVLNGVDAKKVRIINCL